MPDEHTADARAAQLPPTDSEVWDAGLAAAFEADDIDSSPSVLARLERLTGSDTRIHLREAGEGPLVRPTGDGRRREGRYRILGEIARGGVGVILKGRDVELGRDLAMKVLRDDHAGNAELIQRFVEEAQIGGQLQHPGIVPIYELGVDEHDRPYFTMKLVQGETLARLLEDRKSPSEDRVRFLRIFEQVCDAMAYAHARGVVHRDLKPANILVGSFGEVQIVDWGFAKVLLRGGVADESSAHLDRRDAALVQTVRSGPSGMESQVGSVMGTPSYMPPEQAAGHVGALDERTDVFALGAILCEIVTGKPPYVGDTIVETALKARKAELGDALARLDACDADAQVVTLTRECLQVEPSRRPRDAGRVAAAIAACLESLEKRAHDAQLDAARAVERAHAERRTRRLQAIFGACAVGVIALATGVFLWLRAQQAEQSHEIETRIHEALREAARFRGAGVHERAAVALEHARTLAGAPGVSPDLVQKVEQEVAAAERTDRDSRLIAALEAVRSSDDDETALANDVYEKVFRAHGIDLPAATAEQVIARTGLDNDLARTVAFALDDWVFRLGIWRGMDAQDEHLLRIAQQLDDNAWRNALREAALARDAERLIALAEEADPHVREAQSLDALGLALRGAREPEVAIDLLRRSVRARPGDFYLHFHLAMLLTRFGGEGAEEEARIALALRPDSMGTRLFLVRALALAGDVDEARGYLAEAENADPTGPRTRVMRAQLLIAEGDLPGALAAVEEVIRTTPEPVPPLHLLRATILLRMNDLPRAKEALVTFLQAEGADSAHGPPGARPRPGFGPGPGPGPGKGSARRGGRSGLASRLPDANGDGTIDRAEMPERLESLFDVLDRDGSGGLTGDELRVLYRLVRELPDENPQKGGTKPGTDRDQG